MPETFIELVPRCEASLRQSMTALEASDVPFDGYNIPEVVRQGQSYLHTEDVLRLRSEGKFGGGKLLAVHLRTRGRSVAETVERVQLAARSDADIALLVTGDSTNPTENTCVHAHDVLAAQTNVPPLCIGVAADIYRPAWGRWSEKIPAIRRNIARAVFTQPIFHASMLEDIERHTQNLLSRSSVYVGITWISNERNRRYWHERNAVPTDHLPRGKDEATISRNSIVQAIDVVRAVRQQGYSLYVMLMRGTIAQLERVFSSAENYRDI
jgi:5,10-methylenetetrahydrofolate reductase